MVDQDRLLGLIRKVAAGDYGAKQERDQLQGAVQVKLIFWCVLVSQH